ncbi:hypothetical protein PV327_009395 [Microctonus hyperodae]|uniref:Peroxisomal multifunctional enzyme type 2 n=1 Tax=Microctonus hyperodae TaxID=165561 RepID=A0AA39FU30_MICHY|nr:hypothetical protein PV327_009395 [Microctonus hyperodae]
MANKLRFDGKVVVITGAGAGLGKAYALLFASRGAKVVINDLGGGRHGDGSNTKVADTVVSEIKQSGGEAVANYDNVLEGEKIVQTAINTYGRIDILVNNAGILRDKTFARMSESDWDVIHNVHVKGSMKTTQAAWPYFRKQKYGKIIFTSSNSGLYGNFGQANYSSAKMALIGLANTLAIEGQSSGIYTNVIVPTAGSRLTEDIVPPDFFNELKPELIAPIVLWLCHEDCSENGSIIESALGWAGKCHLIRSNGCILRSNKNELINPEAVQDNWGKIIDMTNAKHYESIVDVSGELMNVIESFSNKKQYDHVIKDTYSNRDVILYALSVGATVENSCDYPYLYENHENFSVLPTFYIIYGAWGAISSNMLTNSLPNRQINLAGVVHGEQYFKVLKNIPTEATVETRFHIQATLDKGKNAMIIIKHETFDTNNGDKITEGQLVGVVIGAGGFGGPKNSQYEIPIVPLPKRKPDISITQSTSYDQAALYRLGSHDFNPLHIDPNISQMGGYEKPILHGLCSLGFSTRHVLNTFADGDSQLFDSMKVRFSKPVTPGNTLRTDMWREGNRIHFETVILETGIQVITGAYIDLKEVKYRLPNSRL